MPYLIQGDEAEIGPELLPRLAEVMAEECRDLVLTDALYRLRNAYGIVLFEDRAEAERVAARFTNLGFANFLLDELLPLPRGRRLGPEAVAPEEAVGLVVLARLETEKKRIAIPVTEWNIRVGYAGIPVPVEHFGDTPTSSERTTAYRLDFFTREHRWFVKAGVENRIVDMFLKIDVSEAKLSEGVRSLSRGDRTIPLFHKADDHERYLTWLYQLRYA
jgi:hypothetical protein